MEKDLKIAPFLFEKGRDFYTLWLLDSLRRYYVESLGAKAFVGAECLVGGVSSAGISDDIISIIEQVANPNEFLAAIVLVLERLDFDDENEIKIAQELFGLCSYFGLSLPWSLLCRIDVASRAQRFRPPS